MVREAVIIVFSALCSVPAHGASLILSPQLQETYSAPCTLNVSADELVNAKGLDVEVIFDRRFIRCSSAQFIQSALPGFSEFRQEIDNDAGSIEAVLLKQTSGGYTGAASSFLVLIFEPGSLPGVAEVYIRSIYLEGDPLLIDESGASVEAGVDTATIDVREIIDPPDPPVVVTKLHPNYPNPFNPGTTIRFDVSARSPVYIRIFDVNGRLIRVLINGKEYGNGAWEETWDGRNDGGVQVQSGVYLCVYEASGKRMSSKLVLLR